jgi:hypothetical protein
MVRAILIAVASLAAVGGAVAYRHFPHGGPLPPGDTEIGRLAGRCSAPLYCGDVGYLDCGAAVDGPAFYFNRRDGRVTGHCGGSCMTDSTGRCRRECPPPQWTCVRAERLAKAGGRG